MTSVVTSGSKICKSVNNIKKTAYADICQKDKCSVYSRGHYCLPVSMVSCYGLIAFLLLLYVVHMHSSLRIVYALILGFNFIYTWGLFGWFHILVIEEQVFRVS